jgi:hypothetical protein
MIGEREYYFWGGLWANETPFSMLPLSPSTAAFRSVFSLSSILVSGLIAFSTPDFWIWLAEGLRSGREKYA